MYTIVNATSDDPSKNTPLHEAAYGGELDILKYLISKGANIEGRNHYGETPLHCAVKSCSEEVITLLLKNEYDADVDARTKEGKTPLHLVIDYKLDSNLEKERKVVELFLKRDADVHAKDAKDEGSNTPLHYAAFYGNIKVILLLLEKGAYIESKNHYGKTPLHYACAFGHAEVVELLTDFDALKSINKGLDEVAYINAVTSDYSDYEMTALHIAIIRGGIEVAKTLLDRGANTDIRNKERWTPLHYAIGSHNKEATKLLLDAGADVNVKNKDGETSLGLAERISRQNPENEGLKEILDLLKQRSAEAAEKPPSSSLVQLVQPSQRSCSLSPGQ